MKIVREYLNEKFTDESNPIEDMGIGKRTPLCDLIDNEIPKLFVSYGYAYRHIVQGEYEFTKNTNGGQISTWITGRYVAYAVNRNEKDMISNRLGFSSRFYPRRKFLGKYRKLNWRNVVELISKELYFKTESIRQSDKQILKTIESLIKESEYILEQK